MKRTALVLLGLAVVGTVAARQQENTHTLTYDGIMASGAIPTQTITTSPICIVSISDINYKCPDGVSLYRISVPEVIVFDEKPVKRTRPPSHPCNINPGGQDGGVYAVCITGDETYETCADSSRVLLTSEDGKGHCYKFPK